MENEKRFERFAPEAIAAAWATLCKFPTMNDAEAAARVDAKRWLQAWADECIRERIESAEGQARVEIEQGTSLLAMRSRCEEKLRGVLRCGYSGTIGSGAATAAQIAEKLEKYLLVGSSRIRPAGKQQTRPWEDYLKPAADPDQAVSAEDEGYEPEIRREKEEALKVAKAMRKFLNEDAEGVLERAFLERLGEPATGGTSGAVVARAEALAPVLRQLSNSVLSLDAICTWLGAEQPGSRKYLTVKRRARLVDAALAMIIVKAHQDTRPASRLDFERQLLELVQVRTIREQSKDDALKGKAKGKAVRKASAAKKEAWEVHKPVKRTGFHRVRDRLVKAAIGLESDLMSLLQDRSLVDAVRSFPAGLMMHHHPNSSQRAK